MRREDLTDELGRRLEQQSIVVRLGDLALSGEAMDALLAEAVDATRRMLGADVALLNAPDADPARFRILASSGAGAPAPGTTTLPAIAPARMLEDLLEHGPNAVEDLRELPGAAGDPFVALGLLSGAAVAVGAADHPLGVLTVHCRGTRRFRADDLAFLRSVAHVLSAAARQHRAEERIRYEAMHDALTGLPNRALLDDRLRQALARARRQGTRLALLFLDVDNLKILNDSLGHKAGDELLLGIAPRLQDAVRATDTVARFGGDEFVILCEDVSGTEQAMATAARVLGAFDRPVQAGGAARHVSCSVGVVVAEGATSRRPDELIGDADAAMYHAKARGRGRVELFDAGLRDRAVERLRVEEDLRRALERGELRVAFQPVVQLDDGAVRGFEALVRWEHPERGTIAPDAFIPVAEETGLVLPLGEWVLRTAVAHLARWRAAGHGDLRVSVNVSARQVMEPGFPDTVADALAGTGVPPERLLLEITERVLLDETPAASEALAALKAVGVTLILDDFGTGYSSLSYLRRHPLDGLKIDRAFVADLGEDATGDDAILVAIVSLARALGLAVVPEGVETAAQLERLAALGCSLAQGYHLGRPMPAAAVDAYLAAAAGAAPQPPVAAAVAVG